MAGPKKKRKLKKDTPKKRRDELMESINRIVEEEGRVPEFDKEKAEVWMMGDEVYETTEEDRKRMRKEPEDIGLFGGGRTMRYFNEGGGVYGYFHGGGVDKNQGQYDIQVKKIKGKGKVL